MTNKEKLKDLRKLLARKENWTQDTFARTKTGRPCEPKSKHAVSFCLYGGCERVGIIDPGSLFHSILLEGIATFNDDLRRSHKDILRAIDKAIKICET